MTANAFEGKLHSYRRTQDGAVVAFVIHPSNVTAELALAPIGTRFMIGHAEIGDDETPTAPRAASAPSHTNTQASPVPPDPEPPRETAARKRTPFAELPLSQQAGLLCKDETFRAFLEAQEHRAYSTAAAEDYVRGFCDVMTRAHLDEPQNATARKKWRALYDEFAAWKLTQAYAETIR